MSRKKDYLLLTGIRMGNKQDMEGLLFQNDYISLENISKH